MATADRESRPGHAMACFRALLELGVYLGMTPQGQVAIDCEEAQWPTVQRVLDGAPEVFSCIVEEHCCEPWSGIDAPYVADAVRFNHSKKPNLMTWKTERGRIKQMVHRKKRGRWNWTRVR